MYFKKVLCSSENNVREKEIPIHYKLAWESDKQPHSRNGGYRERIMKTKIVEGKVQTVREGMFIIEVERRNRVAPWPFKLLHQGKGF